MIQNLEDLVGIFCAYGVEYKIWGAFPMEGKTPDILEKAWNPRLPEDKLKKDLLGIYPTASSFNLMLDKVKQNKESSMDDTFEYSKQKMDKSHKVPELKVGSLFPVSPLNFNNNKGQEKLEISYVGPLFIAYLHGEDAVQVEVSSELEN
ncbi:hypothetical protein O181_004036 [Austropuccinia psidii MF-1]|uniref:Uncharacterized protein n=1 Tax=Austropuccinia psidii MF-1 TaxID=1389203 RepID=A0A9Q3GEN6_9BASI|nr:hypothetical protein [Austropuccinia psidii MF-1]